MIEQMQAHLFMDLVVNKGKQKMVLFGAGNNGILILNDFKRLNITVDYFCDSDTSKIYQKIQNIAVMPPDFLNHDESYIIIITAKDTAVKWDIYNSLKERGLNAKIFFEYLIDYNFKKSIYFSQDHNSLIYFGYESLQWYYHLAYDHYPHPQYIAEVYAMPPIYIENGYHRFADKKSEFFNVADTRRRTTNQPTEYVNTIWMIGNSKIMGLAVEDADTIASNLQRLVNRDYPKQYRIINSSLPCDTMLNAFYRLKEAGIRTNDIVIMNEKYYYLRSDETEFNLNETEFALNSAAMLLKKINEYCLKHNAELFYFYTPNTFDIRNPSADEIYMREIKNERLLPPRLYEFLTIDEHELVDYCTSLGIKANDLSECIQRPHNNGCLFVDAKHFGPKGNRVIADKMYRFIMFSKQLSMQDTTRTQLLHHTTQGAVNQSYSKVSTDAKLREYLSFLKNIKSESQYCGAIVMNANPFSLGHKFLAVTSAREVDHLYVFVLEEDESFYAFKDRFAMVKAGLKEIENITVIPSGNCIISSNTFPEYFDTSQKNNLYIDCSFNLFMFCNFIAPTLNIKKRFVGTEPYSIITNSYNEQMKRFLPKYGIELIEMERIKVNGIEVSATQIRDLYMQTNYLALKAMVPETTLMHLKSL